MSVVLEVERLSFGFGSDREVLHDISFAVSQGECLGVVGANGSGKSTLVWCVLGLYRANGSVWLFGEPLSRKSRHRVGVVFQNPEDQLFMPRLADDIALPLVNRGMGAVEAAERAHASLEAVDLAHTAGRPAAQLSLGERKRAAIAAALVTSPELLILDEPTAELDGRSVRRLTALLKQLPVARLITSHDLDFLRGLCSRLLVLSEGTVMAEGPTTAILDDTVLLEHAGLV